MSAVAVLASLAFIGWLIYRAVRGKSFKAHNITYGLACVAGIFTFAFFINMDIPQLIKVVVSILLGMVLIVLAALLQRRRQPDKP
jgi:phosphatidylserine synthase